MTSTSNNQTTPVPVPPNENPAPVAQDKSLLDRLLKVKEWIGLGIAIVTAIVSSGGWLLTYFAKKEEVDILSCTMDVNVRLAKDNSSIQLVRERNIQLKRELRNMKQSDNKIKGHKVALAEDDGEYDTVDELKAAIRTNKDNLKILSDDSSYFINSLARKECDSKDGRDKLRDKLRAEPPLKGD